MRTISGLAILSVATLAIACSGSDTGNATSAVSDDLRKDLDAAAAASVELASSQGYQARRFVSAIEQGESSAPAPRAPAKKKVVKPRAADVPQETKAPAPEPEQKIEVAEAPQPEEQQQAPTPEPSPDPAPRPTPMPVQIPSTGDGNVGAGGGSGPSIGEIIGVVIRGGSVGVGHCPPVRRPGGRTRPIGGIFADGPSVDGRGGGILINDRVPIGIGRPTFPRR